MCVGDMQGLRAGIARRALITSVVACARRQACIAPAWSELSDE
jgi:hypothetical protein